MNISDKIQAGISVVKVKLLNKKIPIAVRIELTNRCPNKCVYCDLRGKEEPSKEELFRLINELKSLGNKKISFSGGEPVMRDDIGEIIDYTKKLGISPEMNSSGFMVKEKIDKLKNLDVIKISLDGNREIHTEMTGRKKSFDEALSAIEACRKAGIKVVITTTLTKYNVKINVIDYLLELAKKYDAMIAFQPVKKMVYSKYNIDDIMPEADEFKKAVEYLIEVKKKKPYYLRNTISGLKYIYNFPEYKNKVCVAGKLFIIVDIDGTVYPCDRVDFEYKDELPNWKEYGLKKAIEIMPEPMCSGCGFCGALELAFLLDFNIDVMDSVRRLTGEKVVEEIKV